MKEQEVESLLMRHIRGEATAEESVVAQIWLENNIADPKYDAMFGRLLAATPADADNESINRIRRQLEAVLGFGQVKPARRPARRALRITGGIAAAVVLAVSLLFNLRHTQQTQTEWNEIYVGVGETRQLVLPDGSCIWLNSDSRVFYPSGFDAHERRIYIDGHIFADIAHDAEHPFVVLSAGVEVRVLGTQFNLKSYARDANIEVALIEGSVAMQAGEGLNAMNYTLVPGDMVRYDRSAGTFERYRIDTGTYSSWHLDRKLCFVNQTLAEIAADLERHFGVNIVVGDEQLASTRYYSSFINNESLDQILRALNSNNTMRISRINNTIIIMPD